MTHPEGGDRRVGRIGYGAMRLPGVRGTAEDTALACDLLQEAVGLGASVIDTADFYGGGLANRLIAKALAPYPDRLIISTKVGVKANADGRPAPAATPQEIRDTVERDLGNLGLSALDLVFLRLPGGPLGDSGVPMERSLECLAELQSDGIVRHIGLSSATAKQIEAASAIVSVDAVQNALFIGGGQSTEVVQLCTDRKIPFFAYFPLGMGTLIEKKVDLTPLATTYRASTSQVALAWLLSLSPVVVPIPGTSNPEHLRENMASERIVLSNDDARRLSDVA